MSLIALEPTGFPPKGNTLKNSSKGLPITVAVNMAFLLAVEQRLCIWHWLR